MDLSLNVLKEAVDIRQQIDQLERRLASLFGGTPAPSNPSTQPAKRRRGMSAAARARLSAAATARWAKARAGEQSSASKSSRPSRGITPAGRKRLSEAMKARWAARKQSAGARNRS